MILALTACLLTMGQQARPKGMVYDIEVAPNDKWMAVSASSDDIWIYSLEGKLLHTLHHKEGSHLIDIEISPDGKHMVCTNHSLNGDYCPVWRTDTWQETAKVGIWITKTVCDAPISIEYAGNGKYLIGQSNYSHELFCWSAETGAVSFIAKRTKSGYYGFAVNPKTTFVALYEARTQRLRFWDILNSGKTREWGSDVDGIDPKFTRNMKFSHDGKQLFVITQPLKTYCNFNILKPVTGKTKIVVQDRVQGLQPRDIAWAGDDSKLWVCGLNGQIVCFDPSLGSLTRHWTAHDGAPIHALAATHRGHTIISSAGETICVWNGDTGKLIRQFTINEA